MQKYPITNSMHKNPFAFLLSGIIIVITIICFFSWLFFSSFLNTYNDNTAYETADHLNEINYQAKLYIEEVIQKDWSTVHSIGNSFAHKFFSNDEQTLDFLKQECRIWGLDEVYLYTESGYGISTKGNIKANDEASDVLFKAIEQGEYLTVLKSTFAYSIPVNTNTTFKGSRIRAVSLLRNLDKMLDNMEVEAFDATACIYFAQQNGSIISRVTSPDTWVTFNIISKLKTLKVSSIKGREHKLQELTSSKEPLTFKVDDSGVVKYIVATPINTVHNEMRLFFVVRESIVNKTRDKFSLAILKFTVLAMSIFTILALAIFILVYTSRRNQFAHEILSRERLFKLLTQNTDTAFALLSINSVKPLFSTSNTISILGYNSVTLIKSNQKYTLLPIDEDGNILECEAAFTSINEKLHTWNGKTPFISDFAYFEKDFIKHYYVVRLYPNQDTPDEFVVIIQNVTHEQEREHTLRAALALADQANASKTRFLANMSHDIRTPMNAILNMTQFALERTGDDNTLAEYLNSTLDSSKHLLRLINDILDISRIESGLTTITNEPFDLLDTINNVSEMIQPLCNEKQQSFIVDYTNLNSTQLRGDKLKLSQVFINLLNNAVKFTPQRGVIRFTIVESPSLRPDTVSISFAISDTGMGIPNEKFPYIFDPFTRGDSSLVSTIEGTGLGLSICRSYIKSMGGSLSCESVEGKGSTFLVQLSFARSDIVVESTSTQKPQIIDNKYAGKTALICEDNEMNQVIAQKILEKLGFSVEIAENGKQGADIFTTSEEGYFDIIFMDVQMPILNGYEASKLIRSSNHPQAETIPIVAMTANVFTEDVELSRKAGMNAHIGKPIIVGDLVIAVDKAMNI